RTALPHPPSDHRQGRENPAGHDHRLRSRARPPPRIHADGAGRRCHRQGGAAGDLRRSRPAMSATTASPRPNRRWIWFFAILLLLTVGGITWEVWYKLRQQLTPEQLTAARQLWNEQGPRDYILKYEIKLEYNPDPAGVAPLKYKVKVRDGKV